MTPVPASSAKTSKPIHPPAAMHRVTGHDKGLGFGEASAARAAGAGGESKRRPSGALSALHVLCIYKIFCSNNLNWIGGSSSATHLKYVTCEVTSSQLLFPKCKASIGTRPHLLICSFTDLCTRSFHKYLSCTCQLLGAVLSLGDPAQSTQ